MSAHLPVDAAAAAAAEAAPDLAAAPFLPSRKTMGWTAIKQRQFLELVAVGNSVETAAHMVQLSHQSAYAFRASARGAVFALGWRAALLLARDRLADAMLTRALDGQTVTITRDDGSEVHRHYHDNRLATATLTRLDRIADGDPANGTATAGGLHAARLAAQEWDTYLDLVEGDAGPARAALFVARRSATDGREALALEPIAALARADLRLRTGVGDAAEVAIVDLDPARRAEWTAEQWVRAEAAGLLRLAPPAPEAAPVPAPVDARGNPQPPQHSPADPAAPDCSVWWDDDMDSWRTDFPPPPGLDGDENGAFGDYDYCRELDAEEAAVADAHQALDDADWLAEATAERDVWLAEARAELAADEAAWVAPDDRAMPGEEPEGDSAVAREVAATP